MKKINQLLKFGLLALALAMTLGSVFAPAEAVGQAVTCKPDPGDKCTLSSGDVLIDFDEADAELETAAGN